MSLNLPARRQTLGEAVVELELVAREIEEVTSDLSDAMLERFSRAQLAVSERTDAWIQYLDAAKVLVAAGKDKRDRVERAYRAAQNLEKGLRRYLRFQLEAHPDVPFKGSLGSLRVQKNPEALRVDHEARDGETAAEISIRDVTVRGVIHDRLFDLDPSLRGYAKEVTFTVLDREKLKGDLQAGLKLPWARLERGTHIRIGG